MRLYTIWIWELLPSYLRLRLGYFFNDAHTFNGFSCTGDNLLSVVTPWTAPRTGYYVFDTSASSVDTELEVRYGCSRFFACHRDSTSIG